VKIIAVIFLAMLSAPAFGGDEPAEKAPEPRFESVDVFIDSGEAALAVYQVEIKVKKGNAIIVGVEGGEHPAFKNPPYYDPAALQHGRIILAAFNTGNNLPKGKTRVARLHVQVTGAEAAEYEAALMVAASASGAAINATVSVGKGDMK
jgi:hypothetical protein